MGNPVRSFDVLLFDCLLMSLEGCGIMGHGLYSPVSCCRLLLSSRLTWHRRYFVKHLTSIVDIEMTKRKEMQEQRLRENTDGYRWRRSLSRVFTTNTSAVGQKDSEKASPSYSRVNAAASHNHDRGPVRITPEGAIMEEPLAMSMDLDRDDTMINDVRWVFMRFFMTCVF